MPSLILTKPAAVPAGEFDLSCGPQVIGRLASAGCHIVLPGTTVSKVHVSVCAENGRFFVTDLASHNFTFVNGVKLPPHAKTPLKSGDKIGICEYELVFHEGDDTPTGAVEIARDTRAAPEERLAALLALGTDPARADRLAAVHGLVAEVLFGGTVPTLDRIADALVQMFEQTDQCVVLVLDDTGWPVPQVTRVRDGAAENVRFCRSLAVRAMGSKQALVADTVAGPAWPEVRSVACVPLTTSDGRAMGAVLLDTRDRDRKFTADDLNLAVTIANLASVALEKARLREAIQAHENEQREIAVAEGVQLKFLPQKLPDLTEYEFFCHYKAAQKVGGDYYDFITLHDGRLAIVVADVSGKGVPAALLVAKLSSDVRTCLMRFADLANAVCALNEQMKPALDDQFVTFVVMVLDPTRHTLTVVNAGHPSPKLHRAATGALTDLIATEASGLPLGWDTRYKYASVTVTMQPHDTVTAFTDGVLEALNAAGVLFGPEAIARNLTPNPVLGADAGRPRWVGGSLENAVRRHLGKHPQNDDIAIVGFGRWEPESDHQTTVLH